MEEWDVTELVAFEEAWKFEDELSDEQQAKIAAAAGVVVVKED